ncbi:MAG: S8 family serine peptidase [Saprospiraceae bacterium]|nr:S8 family serine peptidase [Saprospiraceae bacterium]
MKKILFLALAAFLTQFAFAQQPAEDWAHKNPLTDSIAGINLAGAYDLLKGRDGKDVIVAVIDDGVDVDHEDLINVMWTNEDEIAGNGIDDDNNGYVDDIHGWNFMAAPDGKTYYFDQAEVTQIYQMWREKYDDADASTLNKDELREYEIYLEAKKGHEEGYAAAVERWELVKDTNALVQTMQNLNARVSSGIEWSQEALESMEPQNALEERVQTFMASLGAERFDSMEEMITYIRQRLGRIYTGAFNNVEFAYNADYYPRKMVGDNPAIANESNYGGPTIYNAQPEYASRAIASHGSHVSGIIAAERNNGKGMNGVSDHAKIMMVGAVPSSGDERDKDVANAIRYAVDNGASIINMSFGKLMSPHKPAVDAAYKYAEDHDVLIVHLSHNFATDIDSTYYYPIRKALNGYVPQNVIRVGNSTWNMDDHLPAASSNYGAELVDVFAPGTQIYSTVPDDKYAFFTGTSMATPCVAGLAALLRSYFPDLTAVETKQIIKDSVFKIDWEVIRPGVRDKVPMTRLCNTGGVVNAYNAVKLALEREKE